MMFNIVKWFTGFTLIQLKENLRVSEAEEQDGPCPVLKTADGMLYANCVNISDPLISIPDDLNRAIQILNISLNPILSLEANDLKPFTELVELVMCSLNLISFAFDVLLPLQKLQILKISHTPLDNPAVKLPSTLKVLYADYVNSKKETAIGLDFTKLIYLEELSLVGDGFQALPNLNSKAPLIRINLMKNPIANLEYTALAPFCKLQSLDVENYVPGEQYSAKCCGVRLWLNEFGITSDLKCDIECVKDEKFQFDSAALDTFDECMKADGGFWELIVDITKMVVFPLALIFTFLFLTFKYYRSTAVKTHRRNKKMTTEEIEEEQVDEENENS